MSDDRKYARVYYDDMIRDYPEIWTDDAALATWARMLSTADSMWPTPPEVPRSVKAGPLARLTASTLVELLPMNRYRIKGLDSERNERRGNARNAAAVRWQSKSTARAVPSRAMPTRAEPNQDDPKVRDGLPNITAEAITFLEGVTGRSMYVAGDRQLTEYDRQIEDHGLRSVMVAYNRAAKTLPASPRPTARQLVWSAMRILEPMASVKDTDKAERAAEADADFQRRVERTRRANAELRGEPA